ncbi:kazrin-like [Pteropus medius]|uniref:kazrin-like n=1 Tax=Pteropus vampyrus TaxID=132908 RepID=UPI00196B3616|nr:kazrin-like [Pteropus giganteus]
MSHWKAGTVQAWLEVVMAMPMYVKACAENVKSGKVLLSLSDEDLELGLGVCSSLHRRKLRLAIEDYRDAEAGRRVLGVIPRWQEVNEKRLDQKHR